LSLKWHEFKKEILSEQKTIEKILPEEKLFEGATVPRRLHEVFA
jgi:hypothetical protein